MTHEPEIPLDFADAPRGWGPPPAQPPAQAPQAAPVSEPTESPFIRGLNPPQAEAVLATEGPVIVLAGAGSGKTKMLTSRIAHLIDVLRVPAYQVLAVTFTNKAAAEMRERVEKSLAEGRSTHLGVPEIGTFHSVCVRILRREGPLTPFDKPFVIYDDSDQLTLVKGAMSKLGIDDKSFNPKSLQAGINRAKCDGLEPHELVPAPHNVFEKHLQRVYEQYQKDLFASNALDFGEIICMTYRILRDNPDARERYQRRYRYVHVDEYQDTNRSQYLLLSMLTHPRHGGHQNICVVGDEDQSIYKWRGADIRNILDFETDYPGARTIKLEQNYRSTQTIIKAASHVIRNNTQRKDKTLWTANPVGSRILRYQVTNGRAEAELVVSEIKRLAESDGKAFNDFSIFYRTNAQSRALEDVLRAEKIPYQIVGGLRFYDRKEIKDILSYLRFLLNPADSVSLKRIINVPGRGIGKTTIEKAESHLAGLQMTAPRATLWTAIEEMARTPSLSSAGTARKLAGFVDFANRLMERQDKLALSELYHLILDETAYVRSLREEATEEAQARIENLEEFDSVIQEFERDVLEKTPEAEREARKTELLPLFVEQSSLASDADSLDGSTSSVKMMTLHSSKGLEFPVVFLVGMEEGLFPSVRAWEETPPEDIEEERRLCYVGITRAREQLYMTHALSRFIWGQESFPEPSRFFEELPEDLVEMRDLTQRSGGTGSRSFGPNYSSSSGSDSGSSFGGSYVYGGGSQGLGGSPRGPVVRKRSVGNRTVEVGARLDHPDYGVGTILLITGAGEDSNVTIEFSGRVRRTFKLRYVVSFIEDQD